MLQQTSPPHPPNLPLRRTSQVPLDLSVPPSTNIRKLERRVGGVGGQASLLATAQLLSCAFRLLFFVVLDGTNVWPLPKIHCAIDQIASCWYGRSCTGRSRQVSLPSIGMPGKRGMVADHCSSRGFASARPSINSRVRPSASRTTLQCSGVLVPLAGTAQAAQGFSAASAEGTRPATCPCVKQSQAPVGIGAAAMHKAFIAPTCCMLPTCGTIVCSVEKPKNAELVSLCTQPYSNFSPAEPD